MNPQAIFLICFLYACSVGVAFVGLLIHNDSWMKDEEIPLTICLWWPLLLLKFIVQDIVRFFFNKNRWNFG